MRKQKISTRTDVQHFLKDDNIYTLLRLANLILASKMLFLFLPLALHRNAMRWSYVAQIKANINVVVCNIET